MQGWFIEEANMQNFGLPSCLGSLASAWISLYEIWHSCMQCYEVHSWDRLPAPKTNALLLCFAAATYSVSRIR